MASLAVDRFSLAHGERVRVSLDVDESLERLGEVTNLSVDFFRIDVERNQLAFGFGRAPSIEGGTLSLVQEIPDSMRPGVYGIFSVMLSRGDSESRIGFDPVFFAVRAAGEASVSAEALQEMLVDLNERRAAYINRPLVTEAASHEDSARYCVYIFGIGCLLPVTQQLAGITIAPLGTGPSHRNMHEIVNEFLAANGLGETGFSTEIDQQFRDSNPAFVTSYNNVKARDYLEAIQYCQTNSELIFQLLGYDRGQKPRAFCTMASEIGTTNRWYAYHFPGYKGNLLSDFNLSSTANRIEQLLPKLEASPWARLLMKTYSEASSEEVYEFRLLRYWSILEMVAGRHIKNNSIELRHPHGTAILRQDGKPHNTRSNLGKVYHYVLTKSSFEAHGTYQENGQEKSWLIGCDSSHSWYTPDAELISLWDVLSAIYEIRNSVAHTGQFNITEAEKGTGRQRLAARLRKSGRPQDPLEYVKGQARMALWKEV